MNISTEFRSESLASQQFTNNETTCGASAQSTTGSSTVSLAPFKQPAHTSQIDPSQIDPSQNLVRQTPVCNRAVENTTESLCQNKSVTKVGVKAHGRTGNITKADIKQATEDLFNALTKDLEGLTNDDILALIEKGANVNVRNYEVETALHVTARLNKPDITVQLMNHGADINARNYEGETALHITARLNKPDITIQLMNHGADVNARNHKGETALHLTARLNKPDITVQLMNHGADINARDNKGRTLLHLVAESGQREILDKLLEFNADVNAQDDHGRTPLYLLTCTNGQLDTIQYFMSALIGKGADIKHRDSKGRTPLTYLVESLSNQNAIKCVIDTLTELKADVNASDSRRFSPLHYAAADGKLDVFNHLIGKGANISARSKTGLMVLEVAENKGRKTAKMLESLYKAGLKAGLDVNAPCNSKGATMLVYGVRNNQWDLVDALISHGADINAWNDKKNQWDNKGRTLLHLVAESGQREILDKLLEFNADVNAQDDDGRTPLYLLTCTNGQLDTIQYFMSALIGKGADIKHRDSKGRTPLAFLVKNLRDQNAIKYVIDTLTELKADVNASDSRRFSPLHYAAADGKLDVFNHLIGKGANISARSKTGLMVLEVAENKGRKTAKMLESLYKAGLKAGLDVNAPCNSKGATMLVYGVRNNQWDLVDALISHGADINAWTDKETQCTSLHDAASKGRKDMVSELLKRKADPNLPNAKGDSAIHCALKYIDYLGIAYEPTPENLADRCSLIVDLIENGNAAINAQDKDGQTALHIVSRTRQDKNDSRAAQARG